MVGGQQTAEIIMSSRRNPARRYLVEAATWLALAALTATACATDSRGNHGETAANPLRPAPAPAHPAELIANIILKLAGVRRSATPVSH